MATDGLPMEFGPGERTITRAPKFGGGEFVVSEVFDTFAETNEYVQSLVQGYADAFLADAWHRIEVRRNRDSKGRFTRPPWVVYVTCRRPRPGETYEIGEYPNTALLLEYE